MLSQSSQTQRIKNIVCFHVQEMSKKANLDTEDRLTITEKWEREVGMEVKSERISYGGDKTFLWLHSFMKAQL